MFPKLSVPCSRYFQGDVRAASYEGYGTDIYIYLHALAGEAVEKLPVWSPTASDKVQGMPVNSGLYCRRYNIHIVLYYCVTAKWE